ncbi:MAG: hypothetical protein DBX59_08855 [Bacillota bacterium]|nr:MAG: hypothetical protein DBX59_08855 [Bacillota bacterium]
MAENVLKFDASAKAYKKLADKRLDEDDLEGALSLLLEAKGKTKYLLSIYYDIADIYYEMGLYDYSLKYWFRCLDRAPKYEYEDIYNGIGACYYSLNNLTAATYYFNQQFLVSKDGTLYMDDDILDSIAELGDARGDFKVVYPPQAVDYGDTMRKGKSLMIRGENAAARELFASVPDGAEEYETAQMEIAVAEFLEGDVEGAIARSQAIYERNEHNVFAICNLSSMYKYKGSDMLSGLYFTKLKEEDAETEDDMYKIATSCMEHKKYERAAQCFKSMLVQKPYDMQLLFLYGISLYNAGDFAAAKETFGRILRITEVNPAALSYYRRADSALENGVKNFKPLPNFYRPFDDDEEENTRELSRLLKNRNEKTLAKAMKTQKFWDLVDWSFSASDREVRRCSCYLLALGDSRRAEEYLLDKLLDPTLSDDMKGYISELLALRDFDKTVGVVLSNVYKKVSFYALNAEWDGHGDVYAGAYAVCVAKCVVTGDYDMRKVYDAALSLYFATDGEKSVKEASEKTVAALIFMRSGVEKVMSVEECAELFNCSEKELKRLMLETEKV